MSAALPDRLTLLRTLSTACVLLCTGAGCRRHEAGHAPSPAATAAAPHQTAAEENGRGGPAILPLLADLPADPVGLPRGQTLGDALPPLPPLPPRLGQAQPARLPTVAAGTCKQGAPPGAILLKRLVLDLASPPTEGPKPQLEVCLLQMTTERIERAGTSGRRFRAVAVWPDGAQVSQDMRELARLPLRLPADRAQSGHDGSAWATLVATGDPRRPALAIASARFYDGLWGEEVHLLRRAAVLVRKGEAWTWQSVGERASMTVDLPHLRALCKGQATASVADRTAGAVDAACKRVDMVQRRQRGEADARMATRRQRLQGQAGGEAASDADPQSIWLRDGRTALAKGETERAIQWALMTDMVCGEAVREAHQLIREALQKAHVTRQASTPVQGTSPLCPPLVDRVPAKRTGPDKGAGSAL